MMKELRIVNYHQALFYVDHGVQPIRIERGEQNRVVYIFTKEQTYELYGLWIEDCKKYKNKLRAEGKL